MSVTKIIFLLCAMIVVSRGDRARRSEPATDSDKLFSDSADSLDDENQDFLPEFYNVDDIPDAPTSAPSDNKRTDCLEALFTQAGLRKQSIPRYIQAFRNNELDVDALYGLNFLELVTLLQGKAFGITNAGDIFRLHNCIHDYGKCIMKPFCQNGGRCVHVDIIHQHICQCPEDFQGDHCQEKAENRLSKVEDTLVLLQHQVAHFGVSYTRWGKETCNETAGASLVYTGFMAGSHFTHKGGAAEYLCLPEEPQYGDFKPGVQSGNLVYVSELETSHSFQPFTGLFQHNPLCAVCQADSRVSHIMIPARNTCPSGWTLEYHGYLMAGYHGHRRTKNVCVDVDPDVGKGTSANQDGALLYFTEVTCQSEMACPPYDKEKELTCAVCTR
ncbi:uncharacterized protein LOC135818376 [Sycon ciliatum]|uniref:uncharacterized protein LOC135818376 n=1 Tax=Sycon ciliatum TaxID=27933 RepID=UPI0031F6B5E0